MSEDRDKGKFALRMPAQLREEIAEAARASGRSINAEVVLRLEQSLSTERKAKALQGNDPLLAAFHAVEGIGKFCSVIMAAVVEAKVKSGEITVENGHRVEQPTAEYLTSMLDDNEHELLERYRRMPEMQRSALLALLTGKSSG